MYPRNVVDQIEPSGLSDLQQARHAEMRMVSRLEQALRPQNPYGSAAGWLLRRKRVIAVVAALILAVAIAGIVAAVTGATSS